MAMDFFQHQERARKNTSLLILYYALAVVLIVVAVYGVTAAIFMWSTQDEHTSPLRLWDPSLFLGVAGITSLIIFGGTAFKILALSGGGAAVATARGGRRVDPATRDLDERRVLNVVEEMAIASGTPVPPVYILDDETGINAFAAGFTTTDAVVAVTRGCAKMLTRDELQGVIAHEFSHILNGDMRLNIRLIGVLNGILIISIVGYWVFRIAVQSPGGGRDSRKKVSPIPFILLGLALMVIGYIGVFFARLIQSAISRQREFLADASAVQFTRNPDGIGGALKKIGGFLEGSQVHSPRAMEASHLFFADGMKHSFMNLVATHPPLMERIRRIDPNFDGQYPQVAAGAGTAAAGASSTPTEARPAGAELPVAALAGGYRMQPAELASRVGAPQAEHLAYASALIASFPEAVVSAARDPLGARALVFCLLLDGEGSTREAQLRYLAGAAEPPLNAEVQRLAPAVDGVGKESRVAVVDLCLAGLRELSPSQYPEFRTQVQHLVEADQQVSLFEYALQRVLLRRLDPVFGQAKRPVIQYYDIGPLLPWCTDLLSALAYFGQPDPQEAARAFDGAAVRLRPGLRLTIRPAGQASLAAVDKALHTLEGASAPIKKRIVDACAACVGADGRVTVDEAELLRAIADALDCPIPPFLPRDAA